MNASILGDGYTLCDAGRGVERTVGDRAGGFAGFGGGGEVTNRIVLVAPAIGRGDGMGPRYIRATGAVTHRAGNALFGGEVAQGIVSEIVGCTATTIEARSFQTVEAVIAEALGDPEFTILTGGEITQGIKTVVLVLDNQAAFHRTDGVDALGVGIVGLGGDYAIAEGELGNVARRIGGIRGP